DPDALLDVIELDVPDRIAEKERDKAIIELVKQWLARFYIIPEDPFEDMPSALRYAEGKLQRQAFERMMEEVQRTKQKIASRTAWRIEGTLREFPRFPPVDVWFDYPIHKVDAVRNLKDVDPDDGYNSKGSPWKKNFADRRSPEEIERDKKAAFDAAFEACNMDGSVTVADVAEYLGTTEKTVRSRAKKYGKYLVAGGEILRKDNN
ncbi:MAG: DNA primase, partial [Clostridia bacterium]|nr:DNA primase [Clostridia bacterium]